MSEIEKMHQHNDHDSQQEAKRMVTLIRYAAPAFLVSLWLWYNLESALLRALAMGTTFLTLCVLIIASLSLYAWCSEVKKSARNLPNN